MPVYNKAKKKILDNDIDLVADTIRVGLCTSSYTPDIDNDEFWSTPDDYEVSGTGYSAGGATLSGKSSTVNATDDYAYFDADDVTWTTASFTCRYVVMFKWTGNAATSSLIAYWDLGSNKTVSGIDFKVLWHTNGVLNLY